MKHGANNGLEKNFVDTSTSSVLKYMVGIIRIIKLKSLDYLKCLNYNINCCKTLNIIDGDWTHKTVKEGRARI